MQHTWPIGGFAAVGLAAVMALHLHAAPAQAQGVAGAGIGKQVAGDRDDWTPGLRPVRDRPSAKRGGGGNFDGTWVSASTGHTCWGGTTDVVTISGGQMRGTGFSGQVSRTGSVRGVWAANGLVATVSGQMAGNRGSGLFQRSDGCVGGWTLTKY